MPSPAHMLSVQGTQNWSDELLCTRTPNVTLATLQFCQAAHAQLLLSLG